MYLEIDEGFFEHRKTMKFCSLMMSGNAIAYVLRLWKWACRSAPDGSLAGMDPCDIEMIVQYTQADGRCYAALAKVGFIDESEPGNPSAIHDWMDYTGGAVERMAIEAARSRVARKHGKGQCGGPRECPICERSSAVRGQSDDRTPTVRVRHADVTPTVHATSGSVKARQVQASQDKTSPGGEEPAPTTPPPELSPQAGRSGLWPAHIWLTKFSAAWCAHYGRIAYGNGDQDAKATGALSSLLATLPDAEREHAQAQADEMLKAYLADPSAAARGSPWRWFVDRFTGLRAAHDVAAVAARASPGALSRRPDQKPVTYVKL